MPAQATSLPLVDTAREIPSLLAYVKFQPYDTFLFDDRTVCPTYTRFAIGVVVFAFEPANDFFYGWHSDDFFASTPPLCTDFKVFVYKIKALVNISAFFRYVILEP